MIVEVHSTHAVRFHAMASSNVVPLRIGGARSSVPTDAQTALRAASAPMVLMDLNLQPILFSAGWTAARVTPEALPPDKLWSFFVGGDFAEAADRCIETGDSQSCRVATPTASDGSARWFRFDISPWPSDDAEIGWIIVVGREVTEAEPDGRLNA
ncbi:MAG: Diguanylate cyclase protein [Caulobacter sp.]|nr:Diguanylate cyclase protein [Caulobacter sp.]